AGRVPPVDRSAHSAGQDRAVPAERQSRRPPLDPEPFLPRNRVVQVDVVAGRRDRFAVGGKGDAHDLLTDLGEDVQLIAGGHLKEVEPSVAPGAASESCPVVREGERPNRVVEFVPDGKSPYFFPRGDLP